MDINNLEIISALGDTTTATEIKKGTKVRCISIDDVQSRWGNNDSAKEHLVVGNIYTLSKDPEFHSWHTKYYLEEVPGKRFNSVQFEPVFNSNACAEKLGEGPDAGDEMEKPLNNITEEEIEKQGELKVYICCGECAYTTGYMDLKSAVFKVNMQGGYFMYDGEGGPITKCPVCESDRLHTTD